MSVHPSPIIVEGGRARLPDHKERKLIELGPNMFEEAAWDGEWGYRITRVTNSVDYRPGFYLTRNDIEGLIGVGWTVTVLSK